MGPAELFVWIRLPAVTDDPALAQALLAYGTDGFLIGTAMRPHPGIGQNMAHRDIATGVVSHTLTFHEPVPTGSLAADGPRERLGRPGDRATGGRTSSPEDGTLVASFVQESMIKDARTVSDLRRSTP